MTSTFQPQTIDLSASAVQLIRTALNNPKVTFDKTGLKAFDVNGNELIDIDSNGTITLSGQIIQSLLEQQIGGGIALPETSAQGGGSPSPSSYVWEDDTGTSRVGFTGDVQYVGAAKPSSQLSPARLLALAGKNLGQWKYAKVLLDENGASDYLQIANNLSDVNNAPTARRNLGIQGGAVAGVNINLTTNASAPATTILDIATLGGVHFPTQIDAIVGNIAAGNAWPTYYSLQPGAINGDGPNNVRVEATSPSANGVVAMTIVWIALGH